MPAITELLAVGIGGFAGAITRFLLGTWVYARLTHLTGMMFPFGTLFVNVTGSFLLALASVWFARQTGIPHTARLLISTGFFGAYTTFSTFANETIQIFQGQGVVAALTYALVTNVLCLLAVLIGMALGERLIA